MPIPIVFARDPPARRTPASVLILKCLHDPELKIGDLVQKLLHPRFESVLRNNVDTARSNDAIVDHESVDRVWTMSLPNRRPEIFHDLDRIELSHSNSHSTHDRYELGRVLSRDNVWEQDADLRAASIASCRKS